MSVKHWTTCRVCQSSPLIPVVSLGNQAIVDFPATVGSWSKAPLDLVLCSSCSLLQLADTVDPDSLFRYFWYRSGINEQMKAALAEIVNKGLQIAAPHDGDGVLDIGSNDSTLLSFYPHNYYRVGVEPARNITQLDGSADLVIHEFFNESTARLVAATGRRFKLITAIAMFYDLDDPAEFLAQVRELLAPGGVFIIQMNYLATMLKNVAYDNISHEHVCYYSLSSLKYLVDRCGLEIVDVTQNDVNGGSVRIYITARGDSPAGLNAIDVQAASVRVSTMLQLEQDEHLTSPQTFLKFRDQINNVRQEINRFVRKAVVEKGRRVCLYGASTRGTVLMQTLSIDNYLLGAAERDDKKYYLTMSGTGIRIFPEALCRSMAEYFVVLPWHFLPSILEREKEWGAAGGKFVVPLPEPRIYFATLGEKAGEVFWNSMPLCDEYYRACKL